MIKINLIGVAKPVAAKVEGPPPTAIRHVIVFVAAAMVCSIAVGVPWWLWTSEIKGLEKDLAKEKAEEARLRQIQEENKKYLDRRNQLEMRINTIQGLQNSRVGPVEMMAALGSTVNRTNDLYLITVNPEGRRLNIRGQSNSVESIAAFIDALKATGNFGDVQLRQYFEDDHEGRLSFKFNLDFEFKPSAPAATPPPATTAPAPARRAGT